ncbi:MAG TPA: ABC transporter substrate-binding protein, partial [Arachnia sp.]|nr:ABC transporter substrate-binding protein [Arachnia sp.]
MTPTTLAPSLPSAKRRDRVEKNRLVAGLLAGALTLVLAACGGAPEAAPAPTSTSTVAGDGVANGVPGLADGTPIRVIEDVDHEPVTVPADPQRVVTLSEPTLDGSLALGVTPVGSVNGRGQSTMPNYLLDLADGIPTVGSVAQFNFEAIANLKPDLILTYASGGNNPESV